MRQYDVMPRNGKTEKMYMRWEPSQGLVHHRKARGPRASEKGIKGNGTHGEVAFRNSSLVIRVVYSSDLGSGARSTVGGMMPWTPVGWCNTGVSTSCRHRAPGWFGRSK